MFRKVSGRYWEDGKYIPFVSANFHQWGLETAPDSGTAYSIGIVELSDGKIVVVLPTDLTFLKDKE